MFSYTPSDWHWIVAGDESRWWSSAAGTYVAPDQAWLEDGNQPSRIANEVELNDVLLRQAPRRAMTRTFAPAEIMAALDRIDHGQTAAAFSPEEIAEPTAAMADRLKALANNLGIQIGEIA